MAHATGRAMKPTVVRLTDIDRKRIDQLIRWGHAPTLAGAVRYAIRATWMRREAVRRTVRPPRF